MHIAYQIILLNSSISRQTGKKDLQWDLIPGTITEIKGRYIMIEQEKLDSVIEILENPKWLFHGGMGMKLREIRDGYAEAEILLEEKHGNPIGSIHGGVYLALADNIGGIAAATYGSHVTTVSSHMDFLNAAGPHTKKIIGKATTIKNGKKLCVSEIRIYDDSEKLLATGLYEYMKLPSLGKGRFADEPES